MSSSTLAPHDDALAAAGYRPGAHAMHADAVLAPGARLPLPELLAAAAFLYGPVYAPESTLKALAYYDDGDLANVPAGVRQDLLRAVRTCDPGRLPTW